MISPINTRIADPLIVYKRDRIIQVLDNLIADQTIRFRSEMTFAILEAIDEIDSFPNGGINEINPLRLAKSQDLNDIMNSYSATSAFMYDTLTRLGTQVNAVAVGMVTSLTSGRQQANLLDTLIDEVEVQARSKVSNNAISDERITPETFESTKKILSATVLIDNVAKRAMLKPIIDTTSLQISRPAGIRIKDVRVVGQERFQIADGSINGQSDDDLFTEGYYFGSFFSGRFEVADHKNEILPGPHPLMLNKITDGNPDTVFEVELVTDSYSQQLLVEVDVEIQSAEFITGLNLTMQQELSDWVEIQGAVAILTDGSQVELFEDREILEVGKFQITTSNREIRSKGGSIFPIAFVPVGMANVSMVRIKLLQKRYTSLSIPERVLIDDQNQIVRQYNFLESYIMEHRERPEKPFFDPYLTDYNAEVMTDSNDVRNVMKNRFAIAISEIAIARWQFQESGTMELKPTVSDKPIRSVEVFALEEVAGDPANIKYFIIRGDKADEIFPATRPNATGTRIVFMSPGIGTRTAFSQAQSTSVGVGAEAVLNGTQTTSLPLTGTEIAITTDEPVMQVGLRVVLKTTDNTISPVVKKLALRVKTD